MMWLSKSLCSFQKDCHFFSTTFGLYFSDIKKEFDINPNSFFPKPKIDSTLLSFVPKEKYFDIKNPKNLEKITQIFFNKKRKMIKNPLKQIFKNPDLIANKLKLNINLRPQNLTPLNYFEITKEYEDQLINWLIWFLIDLTS